MLSEVIVFIISWFIDLQGLRGASSYDTVMFAALFAFFSLLNLVAFIIEGLQSSSGHDFADAVIFDLLLPYLVNCCYTLSTDHVRQHLEILFVYVGIVNKLTFEVERRRSSLDLFELVDGIQHLAFDYLFVVV